MWRHCKTDMIEAAIKLYGTVRTDYGKRGTAQWNEDLRKLIEEKRRV